MTNEEQQQLLKYLPLVDTAKLPDRLVLCSIIMCEYGEAISGISIRRQASHYLCCYYAVADQSNACF